jgi:hypothetical protein
VAAAGVVTPETSTMTGVKAGIGTVRGTVSVTLPVEPLAAALALLPLAWTT